MLGSLLVVGLSKHFTLRGFSISKLVLSERCTSSSSSMEDL